MIQGCPGTTIATSLAPPETRAQLAVGLFHRKRFWASLTTQGVPSWSTEMRRAAPGAFHQERELSIHL
jgi:hypothetical protein